MIRTLTSDQRLSAGLIAATVVLGLAALWPWLPIGSGTAAAVSEAPAAESKAGPWKLPPYETFTAATERPLFSPARRPGPAAQTAAPAVQGPYRLVGIIVAGSQRRALVAQGASPPIDVGEGDAFDGRIVKRIDQNRIVLTDAAGKELILGMAPPASRTR